MKVIDCYWELQNLGQPTVEVQVERDDVFSKRKICETVEGYGYAVVKVPMDMVAFNFGLTEMGFTCIETQMNMSISYQDFDFSKVKEISAHTAFEVIDSEDGLQSVVANITPGMFSTDRISLDSYFGHGVGCRRYVNWITTEFRKATSQLIQILYDGVPVGFMLIKFHEDEVGLLLNGLYKPYQGHGLGMLTPASPMLYIQKSKNDGIKVEHTSISSNNIPVVKLYNRLNFEISSQSYVFVRHISK